VPKAKQRRVHLVLDPPVPIEMAEHRVTFTGITLLNRAVMVEYLAEPPLRPFYPFDPAFDLVVIDDVEGIPYPTAYENLARPERGPGRRRPRCPRDRRPGRQLFASSFARLLVLIPAAALRSRCLPSMAHHGDRITQTRNLPGLERTRQPDSPGCVGVVMWASARECHQSERALLSAPARSVGDRSRSCR
jgi:hypothetical protein